MPLFVRKSRSGSWDGVTDQTPEDLTFPADVLADVLDGQNEVSVWEVDDLKGPELDHIVAALHAPTAQNLSDVTFRVVSDWYVKTKLGLRMSKTPGTSLDPTLNRSGKHWVIEIDTVGDAIKLAKAFKTRDAIPFSRVEVMRRVARSLQDGRIPAERISYGLWKKLIEERHLQVVAEQPAQADDAAEKA
jgi:hypothetical protein